jgi:site-specific recombinase XerD
MSRDLVVIRNTAGPELPALIAGAGERAGLRFLEFFTVNIRNPNTRAAYSRAAAEFLGWCEAQGIGALGKVQPVHVATYIEQLGHRMSPPSVKQHLACIRMLFDWLVTGQAVPVNPAHSVRGPRHSVSKGVTPVLSSEEATALLEGMDTSTVVGLRDRALIAVMTYTFARVGVLVALNLEDYFPQKKRWWLRLREKNGKLNEMPCHHKLETYLDAFIEAAGIKGDGKGPLFRAALGKTKKLGAGRMSRIDVWYMVRRRAADAGVETPIGCHTFRATGITDYLTNGGRIEVAQRMA